MVHLWIQPGWIAVGWDNEMLPASIWIQFEYIWVAWPRERRREAKGSEGIQNCCPSCRLFTERQPCGLKIAEILSKDEFHAFKSTNSYIRKNSNEIAIVIVKTTCCPTLEISGISLPKSFFLTICTKGCRHRLFPILWLAVVYCDLYSHFEKQHHASMQEARNSSAHHAFALLFSWQPQRFWPLMRIGQRWKGKR